MKKVFCFVLALYILTPVRAVTQRHPIDLMMAVEMSPGTEESIGLLNRRAFEPEDRVGVIGFSGRNTRTLQSLTDDREALASALQRAGIRVNVTVGGARTGAGYAIDLVGAIEAACDELKRNGSSEKRGVLVLFGSEDPGLNNHLSVVRSALESAHARLYAVAIDRSADERSRGPRTMPTIMSPLPASTVQSMAELTERTGGHIFRGAWDLRDVVKEIRKF